MMNGQARGSDVQRAGPPRPPRWREMLGVFPAIRQVFHALCVLPEGEDPAELLAFAARQEWMADLARRAESVARIDATAPFEPGNDDLRKTLYELYAASRVRDALLMAHQPGPANDRVRELDEALGREQPGFRSVPVDQITRFFAAIGCKPITEGGFDPILHEIITCENAGEPDAPIQVTGHAWPALMIGELVFTRAGVHVRAGSAHAVPGIADRSTLHWEYWRRHRTTSGVLLVGAELAVEDRTPPRLHHDPRPCLRLRRTLQLQPPHASIPDRFLTGDSVPEPLTADQAGFIKNRCQLRTDKEPGFHYLNQGIDERSQSARVS